MGFGDHAAADARFTEALSKDANFVDAYNGGGWSKAKLNTLSGAIASFSTGLGKDSANLEIRAGMAFVYNAQKDYSHSIQYALAVLQGSSTWAFTRDPTVSYSDLHLLLAEDYFAQADYASSLQQVSLLDSAFNADVTTNSGQIALAQKIEQLKSTV